MAEKLKKKDFTHEELSHKGRVKRGVTVNDVKTDLSVDYTFNEKNGTYKISGNIATTHMTGDEQNDISTIDILADLMFEARNRCVALREEWLRQNTDTDPNQIGFGFGDFDDE